MTGSIHHLHVHNHLVPGGVGAVGADARHPGGLLPRDDPARRLAGRPRPAPPSLRSTTVRLDSSCIRLLRSCSPASLDTSPFSPPATVGTGRLMGARRPRHTLRSACSLRVSCGLEGLHGAAQVLQLLHQEGGVPHRAREARAQGRRPGAAGAAGCWRHPVRVAASRSSAQSPLNSAKASSPEGPCAPGETVSKESKPDRPYLHLRVILERTEATQVVQKSMSWSPNSVTVSTAACSASCTLAAGTGCPRQAGAATCRGWRAP